MVKRDGEYEAISHTGLRGGEGNVTIENILTLDQLGGKGRLFGKIVIEPGSSIGFHVHEGEMECFYILSGEVEFSDNGVITTLTSGDTALTDSGRGHSVKNIGSGPLEMIALILYR